MSKVLVQCPVCAIRRTFDIFQERLITEKDTGTSSLFIAAHVMCDHEFYVYIDQNFTVRDYMVVEYSIKPEYVSIKQFIQHIHELPTIRLSLDQIRDFIELDDLKVLFYSLYFHIPILLLETHPSAQEYLTLLQILYKIFPHEVESIEIMSPATFLDLQEQIGMKYKNFCTDMARTFPVGKISDVAKKLIEITEQSFWEGIKNLRDGGKLSDYSKAVQKFVEMNGFSVVRNLVGHGIGMDLHEDPYIPNYWNRKCEDEKLKVGMTLALEPMINEGTFETVLGHDGWVFKTKDGKLSAHYENTILITNGEPEVLTIIK